MKLRKTLTGILGVAVMALSVGSFSHVNEHKEVHAAAGKYVKVTKNLDDWSGDYLIVYEKSGYCLNGSLNSMDAKNNYSTVTISNGEIASTSNVDSYKFTIAASGSGYTIYNAVSKYYIGSNSTSNTLSASTSTKYINTISLNADGSAHIVGSKSSVLRFNTGEKRFRYYKSSSYTNQATVHLYKLEGESAPECQHSTYVQPDTPTYEAEPATCTTPATYFVVCSECGTKGDETYSYGEPLGHDFDELGLCKREGCGIYNPELTVDDRVQKLFNKYYNDGSYIKETYLNVNSASMQEIGLYFHAKAVAPYRKTVYAPGSVTMVTAETEGEYNSDTLSKYEDKNGSVYHTGFGGNWPVAWDSVEDEFVTLNDFNQSKETGWTYSNGVYTYALQNADKTVTEAQEAMKELAREFVAPMWLNTEAAANYVKFDKLTVEEVGTSLVMKLHVDSGNSGQLIDGTNLLFSQAKITKGTTNLSSLATFDLGANGGGTAESTKDQTSYTETSNGYTLSLTSGVKMYTNSFDSEGNGTIKMGAGSAVGKFTFTVPEEVNKVVINVAGRTKTVDIQINGVKYTLTNLSPNYSSIEVDTSDLKTVNFETINTNGEYRCVIDSIEYHA